MKRNCVIHWHEKFSLSACTVDNWASVKRTWFDFVVIKSVVQKNVPFFIFNIRLIYNQFLTNRQCSSIKRPGKLSVAKKQTRNLQCAVPEASTILSPHAWQSNEALQYPCDKEVMWGQGWRVSAHVHSTGIPLMLWNKNDLWTMCNPILSHACPNILF